MRQDPSILWLALPLGLLYSLCAAGAEERGWVEDCIGVCGKVFRWGKSVLPTFHKTRLSLETRLTAGVPGKRSLSVYREEKE